MFERLERLEMFDSQKKMFTAKVREGLERARVAAKVARQTGLMWELNLPGLTTAGSVMSRGAVNPSTIYKIYAANSPEKLAFIWRDRQITYRTIDDRMNRLALGMKKRGIRRKSSILMMLRNRPEFIEIHGASSRIGAAAANVSWRSTASELAYLASHCGAEALFFESDFWPVVERAMKELPQIDPSRFFCIGDTVPGGSSYEELLAPTSAEFREEAGLDQDAAVVIYTSGTTGRPKGAVRKFPKDALPAALRFIAETPMRADDIHLVTCPLYHSTAFGFAAFAQILGGTVVIMDEFKPEAFLEQIERHGVTQTAVVPTILHRVLSLDPAILAKYDTRSLRAIFSVGAPLPGPLALQTMDVFGDILFNVYGSTETGLVTMAKPADLRRAPGTIGKAIPGNEIRLLGDDEKEVRTGSVGELYARNKLLVAGYHKDAASTEASMRDGFFSVGDLARVDSSGLFFIEGRKRDMVISGGVNVYPAEVEGVLEAHPDVSEVAVIGVEDAEWGERVRAFVVARPGAELDEAALKHWCRERLAGPKVPRDYVFLEALPRNQTGKVLKRDLRSWGAASSS